ncbi:MAG: NAD(+) diphosphatase [Pseudohongiellaceae bacterium]
MRIAPIESTQFCTYFLDASQWLEHDRFILFHDRQVLVHEEGFLWTAATAARMLQKDAPQLLVSQSDQFRYLAACLNPERLPARAELVPLRGLLVNAGYDEFALAGLGSQVVNWYASHQYCGACGRPTRQHSSERVLLCGDCKLSFYPRINPCVIMLITRGRQLLLARHARFKTGFYSCLAGFIEVGETPEQTVAREVREEVGVQVNNIRYRLSQSWPFPSQLMLGFWADYKAGALMPDGVEIDDADWFDAGDLPPTPEARFSVAGELIDSYVDQVTATGTGD